MAHWRGFKEYAVDLSSKVRGQLGLSAFQRLEVSALAAHYNTPVIGFDQIDCDPRALQHFTVNRQRSLSGFVLPVDDGFAIVVNPCHTEHRVRATVGHEFSHLILNHEFSVLLAGDEGCAFGDKDQEDEAKWLGAELLFPRQAARNAVWQGISLEQVSETFGVSIELARWRINACGARKILQRARDSW